MTRQYDASSIKLLKFPESIRLRPGMYIGSTETLFDGTNPAFYQLTKEVLDNALDEVLSKNATEIEVNYDSKKKEITIWDNGRGIPVDYHNEFGTSTLVGVFSNMHASGKFDKDSYETSIGTNGVGTKCVNALSKYFKVYTCRNKKWYIVKFEKGILKQDVIETQVNDRQKGTGVKFSPDSSIISGTLNFEKLRDTCILLSHLIKAKITLIKDGNKEIFEVKDGISAYLNVLCNKHHIDNPNFLNKLTIDKDSVSLSMGWIDQDVNILESYVNASQTSDGGTHVKGLQKAIIEAFHDQYKKANFDLQDILTGSMCVLAKNVSDVKFNSQTKEKLITKEAEEETYNVVYPELTKWIRQNREFCDDLVAKAEQLKAIRNKSSEDRALLKAIKGKRGKSGMPVGLQFATATSKNWEEKILYICLAGDTKVQLVDGSSMAIKDMVGKTCYYGYGMNMTTGICEPVHFTNIRKTRENQELVRITLDNGEHFDCTPDHLIVTLNKERLTRTIPGYSKNSCYQLKNKILQYVRADELKEGQSLCSLTLSGDLFSSSTSGKKKIYKEVYKKFCGKLKKGYDIHHIDGNHNNHIPSNLIQLTHSAHSKITNHNKKVSDLTRLRISAIQTYYFANNLNRLKTSIATRRSMKKVDFTNIRKALVLRSPINRAKGLQRLWLNTVSELQLHGIDNYVYKRAKTLRLDKVLSWFDSKDDLIKYINSPSRCLLPFRVNVENNKHLDFERLLYIASRLVFNCIEVSEETLIQYNDIAGFDVKAVLNKYGLEFVKEFVSEYNHKVVSVCKLDEKQDVYCLNAEGIHNFALSCGIFVKNCEGKSAAGGCKRVRDPRIHEICGLRGKIMNAFKDKKSLLESEEVANILKFIGYGSGEWRVGKTVLFADSDVDGEQIEALVLAVLLKTVPDYVKEGRVYICNAPLFVGHSATKIYYGATLNDLYKQCPKGLKTITRMKGLGEIPDKILKDIAFSNTSTFTQIKYNDLQLDNIIKTMGDDTTVRKEMLDKLKG